MSGTLLSNFFKIFYNSQNLKQFIENENDDIILNHLTLPTTCFLILFAYHLHKDGPSIDVWEHYYGTIIIDGYYYKNQPEISWDFKHYFIDHCIFEDSNDGVFGLSTNEDPGIKILHSNCFFNKVTRFGSGGAFLLQYKFCATDVSIEPQYDGIQYYGDGLFCYAYLTNSDLNLIDSSSLSFCSCEDCKSSIILSGGYEGIFSSNISQNIASDTVCGSYDGYPSKFNFSTFESNYAKKIGIFYIQPSETIFEHCNIINNTHDLFEIMDYQEIYLIYFATYSSTLKNCTIRDNSKNSPLFVFSSKSPEFTCIGCNIDNFTCNDEVNRSKFVIDIYSNDEFTHNDVDYINCITNEFDEATADVSIISFLNFVSSLHLLSYLK